MELDITTISKTVVNQLATTFLGPLLGIVVAGTAAQLQQPVIAMTGAAVGCAYAYQLKKEDKTEIADQKATGSKSKETWWEKLNNSEDESITLMKMLIEKTSKWSPETATIGCGHICDCAIAEDTIIVQVDQPISQRQVKEWLNKVNHLGGRFDFDRQDKKVCSVSAVVHPENECLVVISGVI